MTKKERIAALERRVKELEERMAAVEARALTTITPIIDDDWRDPPTVWVLPRTAAPTQVWCPSAWWGDCHPVGNTITTTWDGHGPLTETT